MNTDNKKTGLEEKSVSQSEGKFNKVKRVFALAGAILLVCLYVLTLVFAITDNTATMGFFKASVALTILIPVLLYSYQLVYRVLKK